MKLNYKNGLALISLIIPMYAHASTISPSNELTPSNKNTLKVIQKKCTKETCIKATSKTPGAALILGDGYTSYDKSDVGQSALDLSKASVSYDDLQEIIKLGDKVDYQAWVHDLNVDISESGGWGPFSESAAADYARHTQDTQYSESFTFEQQMYAHAILHIDGLPQGTGALSAPAQQTYASGIQAFTNRYGDEFIQQLPEGALLLVNVQINFDTYADRQSFDAAASADLGNIFSISAAMQEIISQTHSKGSVEVSAYQTGGDPTRLANIFTQSHGSYYFLECRLDNLSACQMALSGVITYAKNDFSHQIRKATVPDGRPYGNLSVAGAPTLPTYASAFGLTPAPQLDPSVPPARLSIANTYGDTEGFTLLTTHLLAAPFASQYAADTSTALKTIQNNLNWNISLFDTFNAINCYTSGLESSCPAIWTNIQGALKPIDTDVLNYMNTAYVFKIAGTLQGTLYPLGDNQFAIPDMQAAPPTLTFAADNSNVQILWYPDGPSTCNQGFRDTSQITGTLPKVGTGSYSGSVTHSHCDGTQWVPDTTAPSTIASIPNPV